MAWASARTIISSLSLFHITLAFFFFTNPSLIEDQSLVYVIGEAMGMPQAGSAFSTPSPANAFLGVVLLVLGISDLVSLSALPEEAWLVHHWPAQAPLRCFVFVALAVFAYATNSPAGRADPSKGRISHPRAPWVGADYGTRGGGAEGLRNRVFFTFAFVEFLFWFWAWTTLKEESRAFVEKKRQRAGAGGDN
ncbi:hypothetical protein DL764_011046 [Monosporascus ibericus]|uniref:Increased loss of mitochondrial DNA protein 1 n=1 Tax=Monosporascus ibericus TaxID=155417 RepID=A0A4V1X8I9_9PEZI|nr:hypothetical protein DL764_011046 [Monosporascus ibericus]